MGEQWYVVQVDQVRTNPVRVLVDGEPVEVEVEGLPYGGTEIIQASPTDSATAGSEQVMQVKSPMPGVIVSVAAQVGREVSQGDQLCVLEVIKLQQDISAPVSGTVQAVHVQSGQSVSEGEALVELVCHPSDHSG